MNAWQKLLAASQLAAGTAWQLISNPKQGVGGGIIVNDGIEVELPESTVEVEITTMQVEIEIAPAQFEVEIVDSTVEVELNTAPIEVEVTQ